MRSRIGKVAPDFYAIAQMVKRLNVARALDAVRNGNRVAAFEAAKWLMKHDRRIRVPAGHLMRIANDKECPTWNRVAAVYTVGMLHRRRPNIAPGLIALLADRRLNVKIRGHAAEALGYYRERSAVPLLRRILLSSESPGIKVECLFALSKMWDLSGDTKKFDSNARSALNKFAQTQPTGKAGNELRSTLRHISDGWF